MEGITTLMGHITIHYATRHVQVLRASGGIPFLRPQLPTRDQNC